MGWLFGSARRVLCTMALLGAAAGAQAQTLAQAQTPGPAAGSGPAVAFEPDLLFHSLRHGLSQVYLASSRTGETHRLRVGSDEDIDATWSPDGRQILFVSRHLTNSDVYLANADGGNVRRLTDHPSFDGGARWSPDGRHIAFISLRDGASHLYLMNADGSGQRRLTDLPEGDEAAHSWAPDGRRIAFTRMIGRKYNLWSVQADGSQAARLTSGKTNENFAVWSPTGTELAYIASSRETFSLRLFNLADKTDRELAPSLARKGSPSWLPDGRQLLVEGRSSTEPRTDIFQVPLDDGAVVNLTQHPAEELEATVSPDGRQLAFTSFRDGAYGQVYVMDLRSRVLKRLTETDKHEFRPVWRPQGAATGARGQTAPVGGVG